MGCYSDTRRQLLKLNRERRDLEHAVLNQAMIWHDLRGTNHEQERAIELLTPMLKAVE